MTRAGSDTVRGFGAMDRAVLERVRPVITPAKPSREILVPADAPIGRYRELLN